MKPSFDDAQTYYYLCQKLL